MFSLLSGGFFVPGYARADIFSTLFGASASATVITPNQENMNSQNMGLLQANPSSALLIEDKNNKNIKDKKIDENKEISIVSDNSLLASTNPIGVSDGTNEDVSSDVSVYVVHSNDSISSIAEMFGVTPDTIRWSNDLKVGQKLSEGDVLFIPPVSGIIHTVKKGETLKIIANKYKVDVLDIVSFNDISEDGIIEVGDDLIIPDAEVVDTSSTKKPSTPKNNTKNKDYYKKYAGKDIGGYYVNPAPQYVRRSQGIHGKNSTDLAAPTGTPIVAAAEGTVLLARYGWNGAYGNMIVIKHPNGTDTLYAHLSSIATKTGSKVSKGEIIGYMGSTGRSTGPHLHFEVHGAKNFTIDLPKYNSNR